MINFKFKLKIIIMLLQVQVSSFTGPAARGTFKCSLGVAAVTQAGTFKCSESPGAPVAAAPLARRAGGRAGAAQTSHTKAMVKVSLPVTGLQVQLELEVEPGLRLPLAFNHCSTAHVVVP